MKIGTALTIGGMWLLTSILWIDTGHTALCPLLILIIGCIINALTKGHDCTP